MPSRLPPRLCIRVLAACAMIARLPALVVYDSATSVDNTKNVIDPANSATHPTGAYSAVPWRHVIRSGASNASATDIKLEVETSETMAAGSWTVEPAAITVLDGTTVFQRVKAVVPPGVTGRKFIRLKATRL